MSTTLYTKVHRLWMKTKRDLEFHHHDRTSTRDLVKRLEQMLRAEDAKEEQGGISARRIAPATSTYDLEHPIRDKKLEG